MKFLLRSFCHLLFVWTFLKNERFIVVSWSPRASSRSNNVDLNIPSSVRFRSGTKADEFVIASTMVQQLMNPLGINSENFIVAEDENTGERVGWAQIRPLGSGDEATGARDPTAWDAKPGSRNVARDDVEETLWEEFEQDETPFPNGFASLPWTKEYRQAMEAAENRKQRRTVLMEAELAGQPKLWELASVFVSPGQRKQGIGSRLVQEVLRRHQRKGRALRNVYALTLVPTVGWYIKAGFEVIRTEKEVPQSMAFEKAAGRIITKIIGEELECIRYSDTTLI